MTLTTPIETAAHRKLRTEDPLLAHRHDSGHRATGQEHKSIDENHATSIRPTVKVPRAPARRAELRASRSRAGVVGLGVLRLHPVESGRDARGHPVQTACHGHVRKPPRRMRAQSCRSEMTGYVPTPSVSPCTVFKSMIAVWPLRVCTADVQEHLPCVGRHRAIALHRAGGNGAQWTGQRASLCWASLKWQWARGRVTRVTAQSELSQRPRVCACPASLKILRPIWAGIARSNTADAAASRPARVSAFDAACSSAS